MKAIILSLSLFLITLFTQAQEKAGRKIHLGIKAGLNISNFRYPETVDSRPYDSKKGFHAGGFAEINIAKDFALQPEILFSTLGFKQNLVTEVPENLYVIQDLHYISIPLLLKYRIFGFGLYAGPQLSVLASSKSHIKSDNKDSHTSSTHYYKRSDLSAMAGIDYTLPVGIGFSVRSQFGLSDIDKDDFFTRNIRNVAFLTGVHYRF
jgi:hypothetical protein